MISHKGLPLIKFHDQVVCEITEKLRTLHLHYDNAGKHEI